MDRRKDKLRFWQAAWWRQDKERGRWAATLAVVAVLLAATVYLTPELREDPLPTVTRPGENISTADAGQTAGPEQGETPAAADDSAAGQTQGGNEATPPQAGNEATPQTGAETTPSPDAAAVEVLAEPEQPQAEDGEALSAAAPAFGMPLAGSLRVSRGYGYEYNPNTEDYRFHRGCDLDAALGSEVRAVAAGEVAEAHMDDYWGGIVIVEHTGGWTTVYKCITPSVTRGDAVQAGDALGAVVNAPAEAVQDPHLHIEVEHAGESRDPADLI